MRHTRVLLAAVLLVAPVAAGSPAGGQQEERRDNLQVAVPQAARRRTGAPGRRPERPARGPDRAAGAARPDGRVLLGGATPEEKGVWLPGGGGAANPVDQPESVPFQPWARALYAHRRSNELEPHTRCKPSGVARQFLTPYGVEIVELPELQRLYIFDIGGPHTYRTVYMDGRTHPGDLPPSYYGHSIGWWEGDTLVIDTRGLQRGVLDGPGGAAAHRPAAHARAPHAHRLRQPITYELTVDDPGAYTAPWTSGLEPAVGSGHRAVRVRLPAGQLRARADAGPA